MAITRVQQTFGGADGSPASPISTANFGSSCTTGNWIIVAVRHSLNDASLAITDTLGTSYSLAGKNVSTNPAMWIYYGKLTATGTNKVNAAFPGGTNYSWCFAVEVSGLATATPLDVFEDKTGTGVTDIVTDAITTAQNDEYVFLAVSQSNFRTYTAGTGFTLVDGDFPGASGNFGGIEEQITSSILSTYVAHITANGTDSYTVVMATFKGPGGGAASIIPQIMHHRKLMAA